ncbi:unnamed protein product [Parascedosporium putredinis]|uniref:FMN hydroxy acid dehydrogenase domain-containing protein n=1 Tax=Parascedosporium putredinis TaxID=1442378 RepID=A0A9P1M6U6_9PEZI|nr:unnamed protein product [Parascedosporium putredinis]CAI7987506.1 unnamed protein product [Parascedosporium putredinis]
MSKLPELPPNYAKALELIDAAHALDPRPGKDSSPFELHYAKHMTQWENPRSNFPMNRAGYLTWRSKLKSLAATQVAELLASPTIEPAIPEEDISRIAGLIRKENLTTNEETQVLEDVACLLKAASQHLQPPSLPRGIPLRKMAPTPNPQARPPNPLSTLINVHDFHLAAQTSFTPKAWAFVTSGATDLHTKRRNSATYAAITLRPRVLRDVSARLVPAGRHPGRDQARGGARRRRRPEIANDEGDLPVFLQLYVDRTRANTEKLLKNALDCGIDGLFLTVDSALPGKREADERIQSDESLTSAISGIQARNDAKGGALGRIMGSFIDPALSWDDVPWLRQHLPGVPLVLKGIQTCADAVKALEAGVDGIVVSNHGGRNLDTAPATIMVLLELRKNCPEVFDRMDVYVDGGITRGTDIFKALCLGAKAVGLGRGFLFSLNYGAEGSNPASEQAVK